MVDFNGVKLKVGDTIFFTHSPKQSVIGKISEIKGKKTILVLKTDFIKVGPKVSTLNGIYANSDDVLKIKEIV